MDPIPLLIQALLFLGAAIAKKSADEVATRTWAEVKATFKKVLGHEPAPEDIDESSVRKVIEESADIETGLEHVSADSSALRRAALAAQALTGANILWIDDNPAGNVWERRMLGAFGVTFVTVEGTTSALGCLRSERFDLVISDISRGDDAKAGLEGLPAILKSAPLLPVIFYVGHVDLDRAAPAGCKGLADEPNELLHLVLDQLERTRL